MTSNKIYNLINATNTLVEAQYRQQDDEYLLKKIETAKRYLDKAEKCIEQQEREGEDKDV